MPNGENHDQRELWEKVRDLQIELVKRADEITRLTNRVSDLEADKEALLSTIELLKEGD